MTPFETAMRTAILDTFHDHPKLGLDPETDWTKQMARYLAKACAEAAIEWESIPLRDRLSQVPEKQAEAMLDALEPERRPLHQGMAVLLKGKEGDTEMRTSKTNLLTLLHCQLPDGTPAAFQISRQIKIADANRLHQMLLALCSDYKTETGDTP